MLPRAPRWSTWFPKGRLLYAHVGRAIVVWVAIHLVIALFTAGKVLVFSPAAFVAVLVVMAFLAVIDTRNRHETVFLANLGVSRRAVVTLWCACALVLELIAAASFLATQLERDPLGGLPGLGRNNENVQKEELSAHEDPAVH